MEEIDTLTFELYNDTYAKVYRYVRSVEDLLARKFYIPRLVSIDTALFSARPMAHVDKRIDYGGKANFIHLIDKSCPEPIFMTRSYTYQEWDEETQSDVLKTRWLLELVYQETVPETTYFDWINAGKTKYYFKIPIPKLVCTEPAYSHIFIKKYKEV